MYSTGAVILSRYSSTRLPGKALKLIKGQPVLQYIIERLEVVFPKQKIAIATSTERSDDAIAIFAGNAGVNCYRGSLSNVAERFYAAASQFGWDYALRTNSDNVFADVQLIDVCLQLAETGNFHFISNVQDQTYPKGMSVEVVKISYYKRYLPLINKDRHFYEHVTSFLYSHAPQEKHFYLKNHVFPDWAGIQLALDTQEDFDRTVAIIDRFKKPQWQYGCKDIYQIYKSLNHE